MPTPTIGKCVLKFYLSVYPVSNKKFEIVERKDISDRILHMCEINCSLELKFESVLEKDLRDEIIISTIRRNESGY